MQKASLRRAKIIDVFTCKLREKLSNASGGLDCIVTVRGRGHALREPARQPVARRPDYALFIQFLISGIRRKWRRKERDPGRGSAFAREA